MGEDMFQVYGFMSDLFNVSVLKLYDLFLSQRKGEIKQCKHATMQEQGAHFVFYILIKSLLMRIYDVN